MDLLHDWIRTHTHTTCCTCGNQLIIQNNFYFLDCAKQSLKTGFTPTHPPLHSPTHLIQLSDQTTIAKIIFPRQFKTRSFLFSIFTFKLSRGEINVANLIPPATNGASLGSFLFVLGLIHCTLFIFQPKKTLFVSNTQRTKNYLTWYVQH
jgi:hypothetical protein